MDILPIELQQKLLELEQMNNNFRNKLVDISNAVNRKNIQHRVLFYSLIRVIKYFDAYLLLTKNGYGEPAACILRSIFEANIWMRWSLIKPENAERYFNSWKKDAAKTMRKLIEFGLGRISGPNVPAQEEIQKMLKECETENAYPRWQSMAKDSGLEVLFTSIYPVLSAMSHGSWLSVFERTGKDGLSPFPDNLNIEPFIGIARDTLIDCYSVCEQWIIHKQLHPPEDYLKLFNDAVKNIE